MQTHTPAATADLLDLDQLLTESVKRAEDVKAAKVLQSRIRSGRASKAEVAMSSAVELKAQWVVVANCEMWDMTICECGHTHATFTQYMLEYAPIHSGISHSHRWVKAEPEETVKGLPSKVIYNTREVFHCSECSQPPEGAEVVIWANGSPGMAKEFEGAADTGSDLDLEEDGEEEAE